MAADTLLNYNAQMLEEIWGYSVVLNGKVFNRIFPSKEQAEEAIREEAKTSKYISSPYVDA